MAVILSWGRWVKMKWDGLGITTFTDPVFQLLQSTIESILPEEGDEEVRIINPIMVSMMEVW